MVAIGASSISQTPGISSESGHEFSLASEGSLNVGADSNPHTENAVDSRPPLTLDREGIAAIRSLIRHGAAIRAEEIVQQANAKTTLLAGEYQELNALAENLFAAAAFWGNKVPKPAELTREYVEAAVAVKQIVIRFQDPLDVLDF